MRRRFAMADFKIGDWVCVISGPATGGVGRVIEKHEILEINVRFSKLNTINGQVLWWHPRDSLRLATTQEIAHHFAEEICND
jgi:hypothetical protein